MRTAAKTAVVIAPFLVIFLGLRACTADAAKRWLDRIAEVDPAAQLVVNEESLIVIAPDRESGDWITEEVLGFREALVADHGDLVGDGRDQRMVVVLFSSDEYVRTFAGRGMPMDPEFTQQLHGYTDPPQGAIFVPPDSSPATLRHETVHWLVATSRGPDAAYSPWLNEGLAQLFETYEPDAWRPVSSSKRALMRVILPGDTIDVERLISLQDYRSFVVDNGSRNYLEALILTAFLFEQRDRALLRRYLDIESTSEDGRALAFRRIYSHHEERFRRDLREYIKRLRSG